MPAAVPFIGLAVGLLGAGVGAVSSIAQGSAQSAALKSQSNAARYNQSVAEMNANAIRQSGAYQEQMQRDKNRRLIGAQKVGYGKAGVTMEGTPLEVMADTASEQEQDIIANRYNTNIAAWRAESQAGQFGFEASRDTAMAGTSTTAGYLGAGTTLLTGASRAIMSFKGASPGAGTIPKYGSAGYGSEMQ